MSEYLAYWERQEKIYNAAKNREKELESLLLEWVNTFVPVDNSRLANLIQRTKEILKINEP